MCSISFVSATCSRPLTRCVRNKPAELYYPTGRHGVRYSFGAREHVRGGFPILSLIAARVAKPETHVPLAVGTVSRASVAAGSSMALPSATFPLCTSPRLLSEACAARIPCTTPVGSTAQTRTAPMPPHHVSPYALYSAWVLHKGIIEHTKGNPRTQNIALFQRTRVLYEDAHCIRWFGAGPEQRSGGEDLWPRRPLWQPTQPTFSRWATCTTHLSASPWSGPRRPALAAA